MEQSCPPEGAMRCTSAPVRLPAFPACFSVGTAQRTVLTATTAQPPGKQGGSGLRAPPAVLLSVLSPLSAARRASRCSCARASPPRTPSGRRQGTPCWPAAAAPAPGAPPRAGGRAGRSAALHRQSAGGASSAAPRLWTSSREPGFAPPPPPAGLPLGLLQVMPQSPLAAGQGQGRPQEAARASACRSAMPGGGASINEGGLISMPGGPPGDGEHAQAGGSPQKQETINNKAAQAHLWHSL